MKTLVLSIAIAAIMTTLAATFATTSHANETYGTDGIVTIVKYGRTVTEAKQKAYQEANKYEPYEVVKEYVYLDGAHIPTWEQWCCELRIEPLWGPFGD